MNNNLNGILLIYHLPPRFNALTIMDHVISFKKYSSFRVWNVNTAYGFPKILRTMNFSVILLHYSLFGSRDYVLSEKFYDYLLNRNNSIKIAFFQDEYYHCKNRRKFINEYGINIIYSLIDTKYHKTIYSKCKNIQSVHNTLTGYVSDSLLTKSKKYFKPFERRGIDIGYRGRELPYYLGEGSREKIIIAEKFKDMACNKDLIIDIETKEIHRIYGEKWYKFLANCKACLGVEAGVSVFDLEDEVRDKYDTLMKQNPYTSLSEFKYLSSDVLNKWENYIPYRVIGPRHFEAAAFKVIQILFEGTYSNILKPHIHYLPLKKDFSNFDEVIQLYRNTDYVKDIVNNSYKDLILSNKFSYERFIEKFDSDLLSLGLNPVSKLTFYQSKGIDISLSNNTKRYVMCFNKYIISIFYKLARTRFLGISILMNAILEFRRKRILKV